ncbi:hypothetical protein F3Y22_tig00111100pilonHSYRG00053 [Hibiscus syriacus]|uniref:RNase H type-1 domain-containing protein n=1 Tax=Hibiscus syriacus TaxID=106335 RepID=A0A6A2Z0F4_HIBSY|nr:hypothetical protein F3Y22_tig00111100pilonHSYRG00053 [Hibiscus syriacus]
MFATIKINVDATEALAITYGLRLVSEFSSAKVYVESDAMNIVRQLISPHLDFFTVSFHLAEAKSLLSSNVGFRVHGIRRSASSFAHTLTRSTTQAVRISSSHTQLSQGISYPVNVTMDTNSLNLPLKLKNPADHSNKRQLMQRSRHIKELHTSLLSSSSTVACLAP